MRPFRFLVLGIALVLVLGTAFFARSALFGLFNGWRSGLASAFDPNFTYANFKTLQTENAGLAAEVASLEGLKAATGTPIWGGGQYAFVPAQVYSAYPFNDSATITINAGTGEGLKAGMPVVAAGGAFVGEVRKVARTQSEVQTIFDPAWRTAVAVGNARTKALLLGGLAPSLDLIPKDASVAVGDDIWNVAPNLPMNLPIGQVTALTETAAGIWTEAQIALPWHPGDLDRVYVITNFP